MCTSRSRAPIKLVGKLQVVACGDCENLDSVLVTADWEFEDYTPPHWDTREGEHYLCGWPVKDLMAITEEYGVGFRFT